MLLLLNIVFVTMVVFWENDFIERTCMSGEYVLLLLCLKWRCKSDRIDESTISFRVFEVDVNLFGKKRAMDIDVDLDDDAEAQSVHERSADHPQRRPNELSSCVAMFLRCVSYCCG